MKLLRRIAGSVILIALPFFCGILEAATLEGKSAQRLMVSEITADGRDFLLISGTSGHSAHAVKKVSYEMEAPGTVVLMVELYAAAFSANSKSATGDFAVSIPKTSALKEVVFGKKRQSIWPTQRSP